MDNVIKSFLVSLGFKVDEDGLKKFGTHLENLHKSVKEFAIGFGALAIGIEESIRRVGRNFEELFFLSAQIGTSIENIKSLQFALGQVGVGGDAFKAMLASINNVMLDSPGMKFYIATLVPGFEAATGTADEALEGLIKKYRSVLGTVEESPLRDAIRKNLHIDPNQIRQAALAPPGELEEWNRKARETLRLLYGIKGAVADKDVMKTAAAQTKAAMDEWNFAIFQVSNSFERLAVAVMPLVRDAAKAFTDWMAETGIPMISGWATSLDNYFKDDTNRKNFKETLGSIATVATELGTAIATLGGWILELNKHLGATGTLLTVLFGFTFLRGALSGIGRGLAALVFAPLIGGASAAGKRSGGLFGAAFKIGAWVLIAKLLEDTYKSGFGGKNYDASKDIGHGGAIGNVLTEFGLGKQVKEATEVHPGVLEGGKFSDTAPVRFFNWLVGRPHSYGGPPIGAEGGQQTLLEMMVFGLQHWWAGSGNFRPYVNLVDSVYSRLEEVLRDVFDLHRKPGAVGAAGGEGTGGGGSGGRFGAAGPGGRRGSGSEGIPGVPDWAGGGSTSSANYKANLAEAVNTLRKEGWSEEAIGGGAVSNALGEGGFAQNWLQSRAIGRSGQRERSFGPWQYNFGGGEGNIYARWLKSHPDLDPKAISSQAKFLAYRMEQIYPGFSKLKDPRQASLIQEQYFERHAGEMGRHLSSVKRSMELVKSVDPNTPIPASTPPSTTPPPPGLSVTPGTPGAEVDLKHIDAVIGDSIAVGIGAALKLPNVDPRAGSGGIAGGANEAIGGTTPEQIYKRVIGRIKDFANKNVVLGSGSNPNEGFDPKQLEYVHKTLAELHKAGAHIALLGVGRGVKDAAKINEELSKYAKEFGTPFTGELATTQRRGGVVHPSDYNKVMGQFRGESKTTQNVNVNVHVSPSDNPEKVAAQVVRHIRHHVPTHGPDIQTAVNGRNRRSPIA